MHRCFIHPCVSKINGAYFFPFAMNRTFMRNQKIPDGFHLFFLQCACNAYTI